METHLLKDLALVMATAGAMTLICHRLKQPVVIGYLVAGLLIGPYTPPFALVSDLRSIHTMAELGLVFLLFSLGLEFSLPKMTKVGLSAGLAAILEVVGMLVIGYWLGRVFGWGKMDSIFLGAILSISSTTIIVKVFMDFKMMQEKFVQVVFGILILEDIVAIAILSILSGLGSQGSPDAGSILYSFSQIGLFVTLFLVGGLFLIPRFIRRVAEFKSKEMLGIVTLGFCLTGAILAHHFGLSVALGAFLAGAVLAASDEIGQIEEWIHPVRDMFSAIFFVSAGMLIQPGLLWEYKGPIIIVTIITIIGKVISGGGGAFLAGYDVKTSARIGMSLAQIGEFSFVIASLGLSLKVTSDFLYPLAIMVSSLTTLATPYLIRNSDKLVESSLRMLPPGARQSLDNYSHWLESKTARTTQNAATAIFSKYLLRLGVYVALAAAMFLVGNAASLVLITKSSALGGTGQFLTTMVWAIIAVMCMPLFMAFAKYSNHIILLLVTRSRALLHMIDVHSFYNTLNFGTILVLSAIFVWVSTGYIGQIEQIAVVAVTLGLSALFFSKNKRYGKEKWESILDTVTGLATSEPTRQAVLKSGEKGLLLVDITDQVTLPANSVFNRRTIRDLQLRSQTGATIVAIYREGRHIANPGIDVELLADDVLILLGSEEELNKAKALLLPPS